MTSDRARGIPFDQNRSHPNILVILTDQLRYPPLYESAELAQYRRALPGRSGCDRTACRCGTLSDGGGVRAEPGVAADRAVPVAARRDQTDGLAKAADSPDMFWLAPDTVPTLATGSAPVATALLQGKWHASHAYLDAEDGEGFLLSIDDDGKPIQRTSRSTWRRICSTTTASRSGSAPSRTGSASTTRARSRTRSPPTRRSRCSSASTPTTARSRG